jgi:hypothetical protein
MLKKGGENSKPIGPRPEPPPCPPQKFPASSDPIQDQRMQEIAVVAIEFGRIAMEVDILTAHYDDVGKKLQDAWRRHGNLRDQLKEFAGTEKVQ